MILHTPCLLATLATLLCLSSSTHAADWKEFRGPNGTGIAPHSQPVTHWSETENIRWKVPIEGRGWSSPAIAGHEIWLTTGTDDGHKRIAICLDRKTGNVIHEIVVFEVEEPEFIHQTNSYASPSPLIFGEHVCLHFGSIGTACVNRKSGKVLWTRTDLPCDHHRGSGSSPIIYQNLIYLHYDGFDVQYAVALNAETGETVWKHTRPEELFETDNGDHKKAYATPTIFQIDGKDVLISPAAKTTFALDPLTGKTLWHVRYDEHSTATRPLYGNDLLYIDTGFSKGKLYAINPSGSGELSEDKVAWVAKRAVPSKPSPLLIDQRIYMVYDKGGIVSCLNALTGDVVWQERLGGNFWASPIAANGVIYLPDDSGTTHVVKADDTYEVIAENKLDEGCTSSMAIVDDEIILRTRTHVYLIAKD